MLLKEDPMGKVWQVKEVSRFMFCFGEFAKTDIMIGINNRFMGVV
jgi:hypothetical protein